MLDVFELSINFPPIHILTSVVESFRALYVAKTDSLSGLFGL